jgi:hypothetical protein
LVEDDGPGLDGMPEEIAFLFSIKRPMHSGKLLRVSQPGARSETASASSRVPCWHPMGRWPLSPATSSLRRLDQPGFM